MKIANLVLAVLCGAGLSAAQDTTASVLKIQVENIVNYYTDVADWSKLAASAEKTSLAGQIPNFATSLDVGDIVSVNGEPCKGVFTERRIQYKRAVNPAPGQFVADAVGSAVQDRYFEILKLDGTAIGTIMVTGLGGSAPAPGMPAIIADGNFAIVGGTGAFVGVRGQGGGLDEPNSTAGRKASATEDPSKRRAYPAGHRLFVLQAIPMSPPRILQTESGPSVVHASDLTPVTAAKPAKAGEVLSLIATGLGPTQAACPSAGGTGGSAKSACIHEASASPVQPNSPVALFLNGKPAVVQNAIEHLGTSGTYRVNFVMPEGVPAGAATLQIGSAWVTGPAITIAVQ